MIKGGLGRGLGSLIPNKINNFGDNKEQQQNFIDVEQDGEKVMRIPVEKIEANPMQPRENFAHDQLEDLIESIKKHGIIQPLIVSEQSGLFQLIAGERRLRAAKILGLKTVPCLVRTVKNQEKLEIALVENIQRSDLNPIEEARAYKKLIEEFTLMQEEVAEKVGKKRATVSNALRLLSLPKEIQVALMDNKITAGHAKVILSAETDEARLEIFKKIIEAGLTVRQSEGEVHNISVKSHSRALAKDSEIKEKEERLRIALGTKVAIHKKGQAGNLVIEFYSSEELEEIIRKIES